MTQLPTKTLPNRATIEPYIGSNATKPKWGSPIKGVKCRLRPSKAVVQGPNSSDRVAKAKIDLRRSDKPVLQSRVTIDGEVYEVLEVTPITGAFRIEGYTVTLG